MPDTYKNYCTKLTSTNQTVIYPGISGTAIVNSIHVSNVNASNNASITLLLSKGDAPNTNTDEFHICRTTLVPIQSSYQALDAPIPLEPGDLLLAVASDANRLDVIVSVLEIT
jgi:hypothetical protein